MFWVSLLVLTEIWVSQGLALGIILAHSLKNVILLQRFKYSLYVDDFQIHILSQNLFSELKTWKPNDYLLSPIWCLPEVRIQVSKYIQQKSWFLSPNCFIFHVSLIKYYPSRNFKNWIIYESSLHITTYSPK